MKSLKNRKPLYIEENKLLLNSVNRFFQLDLFAFTEQHLVDLPYGIIRKMASKVSLIRRLLRAEANNASFYDGKWYVTFNGSIYNISKEGGRYRKVHVFERHRSLKLSVVEGLPGFNDGIYFGEYFHNPDMMPVRIFHLTKDDSVKTVFTFSKGIINHIHNLIPDYNLSCLWILTGDIDHAPGIWKASEDFSIVEPVVTGSQEYRACVAFPVKEGLLYATDSPDEPNHIRLLTRIGLQWISKKVKQINGPCLYGCRVDDKFVFSTDTEPSQIQGNVIRRLFDRKRGNGIITNKSYVIAGNLDTDFKIIDIRHKVSLPYRLFQYGNIVLPPGNNVTGKLFEYNIANKGKSMCTEIRDLR